MYSLEEVRAVDPEIADVIENEIRPAVLALAKEEDLPVIDLFDVFSEHPEMFPDGIHPDADGARLMAETVYKAINAE